MNPIATCQKNLKSKLKERIHEYELRSDGDGRVFKVCKKCGNISINLSDKKPLRVIEEID